MVQATLDMGHVVLVGATLSFIGLSEAGIAEWGVLVSEGQAGISSGRWWASTFPGLMVFLWALAFNLVGDGLRDALDPRTEIGPVMPRRKRQPAPEPAPATIASVRELKIHFRSKRGIVHAVDGVSFDIRDGETLGLVGETGCGKSVTARAFLRLVAVAARHLCRRLDHVPSAPRRPHVPATRPIDLLTIPDARMRALRGNRIAMIFQDPGKALNPALSIRDQIAEVFYQHRTADVLDRPANVSARRSRRRAAAPPGRAALAHPRARPARAAAAPRPPQPDRSRRSTTWSPRRSPRRRSPIPARSWTAIRMSCPAACGSA